MTCIVTECVRLYGAHSLLAEVDAGAQAGPAAQKVASQVAGRLYYRFGGGQTDGEGPVQKQVLGGKGAGLAALTRLGVPVPPGFTLPTDACRAYILCGPGALPDEALLREAVGHVEQATGRKFGVDLFVSVRSGAPDSMPGMMDTVLNLGLNDQTEENLADATTAAFARQCRERFLRSYADVVLGHPKAKTLLLRSLRKLVPSDPWQQLAAAVEAVFKSWNSMRAIAYRAHHGLDGAVGTACNVQAMVFGNMGADSGTGVLFTRDPATGAPGVVGEYLPDAQGEEVVAGLRTPLPLDALRESAPAVHAKLIETVLALEAHFGDVQDIEFTVERGTLYLLQTRNAKRSARAMVRIAVDMVREGLLTKEVAVARLDARRLEALARPMIDPAVL